MYRVPVAAFPVYWVFRVVLHVVVWHREWYWVVPLDVHELVHVFDNEDALQVDPVPPRQAPHLFVVPATSAIVAADPVVQK
jgi:hypothetical protein